MEVCGMMGVAGEWQFTIEPDEHLGFVVGERKE